jgi:L-fuconolactonase
MNGAPPTIDAHQHVWDLDTVPQPWIDPTTMAPIARSFSLEEARSLAGGVGVSGTVVVQTVPSAHETPLLLDLAARNDFVVGVVGWVDLRTPDVGERIARLRELPGGVKLVGVRHLVQDEPDPAWLDQTAVRAGLRQVAAAGLAYDLLVRPAQLPAAQRVVQDLPEMRFVLDHLGKPPLVDGDLTAWAGAVRQLARADNVMAKVSGLVTETRWDRWTTAELRPCVELALETFGPSRLAYGSDWPLCELAGGYARWRGTLDELLATLTPTEQAAVNGGTAIQMYHIPG